MSPLDIYSAASERKKWGIRAIVDVRVGRDKIVTRLGFVDLLVTFTWNPFRFA
jgi:hypothetical protein